MSKLRSLVKKATNLDVDGFIEGVGNFKSGKYDQIAQERSLICAGCEHFEDEPISTIKVEDKAIPVLSGKMCGKCFCALPYKLRQDVSKCPLKKW